MSNPASPSIQSNPQSVTAPSIDVSRNVFALTRPEDFFNLLQDRLHATTESNLLRGDNEFTILINALNRRTYQRINRMEDVNLVYAGVEKQRELIEDWGGKRPELRDFWEILSSTSLDSNKAKVGSGYYADIKTGNLDLAGIQVKTLKSYFETPPKPEDGDAALKGWEAEKAILSAYFDIATDLYISLPVIGFADFDGIAHIVFKKKWENRVRDKDNIWALLRAFVMEYDGMFLDWDVVGDNMDKISSIKQFLTDIEKPDFYEIKNRNPILRDLDLLNYYSRHDKYFDLRFRLSDGVPGKIYELYIVHSIVSILVDSYAHNVSAHSLTTLTWWFRQRSKRFNEPEVDWEKVFAYLERDELNTDAIEQLRSLLSKHSPRVEERSGSAQQQEESHTRKEDGDRMIHYRGHLSREIYPMFQFLMEKGAYWSGITRNVNVGGMVSSLYNILWHDFIQNPLYIGTIAKTEDIQHVRLRVVLYEPGTEPLDAPHDHTQPVRKRILHDGILAEVDLMNPLTEAELKAEEEEHKDAIQGEPRSVFVRKGKDLKALKHPLKDIRFFLPGGVVGKHAFFTMLENEIRNVKHYNRSELALLRKEGLTLSIGIQPYSLPKSTQQELYRLSIWIDAPTRLLTDDTAEHVVLKKWKSLEGELFDSGVAPKLGGTYQDKVCAAMLFNNSFSSVQNGFESIHRPTDKDTERDRLFYPWTLPACSSADGSATSHEHQDFEFIRDKKRLPKLPTEPSAGELKERDQALRDMVKNYPEKGFLKKIFYFWKGQNLLDAPAMTTEELEHENPARFRIVHLPAATDDFDKKFAALRRKQGVIRIITGDLPASTTEDKDLRELEQFRDACTAWLAQWIGQPLEVIKLLRDAQPHSLYVLDAQNETSPVYRSYDHNQLSSKHPEIDLKQYEELVEAAPKERIVEIAHSGDPTALPKSEVMWYRRHGVYQKYFLEDIKVQSEVKRRVLKELRELEFFETLLTRICIFDNRIYHRIRGEKDFGREDFFRHRLKLVVQNEATDDERENPKWLQTWEQERTDFIPTCHFLVIHLSFIERILQKKHKREGDVGFFIQQEIVSAMSGGRVPDNFMLVITTGRGRNDWWNHLDRTEYKNFARFTIFRPVESLISAVERSMSIQDDVELKFRLVKILFGS